MGTPAKLPPTVKVGLVQPSCPVSCRQRTADVVVCWLLSSFFDGNRKAKTLLHSRYNGDWKKDNGVYQTHLDPIWRLDRAQQTTIFLSVTYREAKTLLHSRYNGDWKKDNASYQTHLDPIWRLDRAQQTIIFRLRTGHCGLRAHLKRTGISDTSLCECGQDDQTPDHVLQSCPKYAERRQLT